MKYWFSFVGLCVWAVAATAQLDQSLWNNPQYLEDAAQSADLEEGIDASQLQADTTSKRLNLNRATRLQLLALTIITPQQVDSLLSYRIRFGDFASVYELQAVPGMTEETFLRLLPYITTGTDDPLRIPLSLANFRTGALRVTQRFETTLQQAQGYQNGAYAGSQVRAYTQARYLLGTRLSAGFVAEKDAGEQFGFAGQAGYDFLSGHVWVRDVGPIKTLALGDYHLQLGQGLVLSRGLGFGRGAQPVLTARQGRLGILPNTSANENTTLRGGAAEIALGPKLSMLAFVSARKLDASLTPDSSDSPTETFSIQRTGLHRTETELARRDKLSETIAGGSLRYEGSSFSAELLQAYVNYSPPLAAGEAPYQQGTFAGSEDYATSLSVEWAVRNVLVFGEGALSNRGRPTISAGAMASLSPKVDAVVQLRHFAPGFHTLRGFAFAQQSQAIQNESGLYLGVDIRPRSKLMLHAYADVFQYPRYRYRVSFPANGYEAGLQAEYKPKRTTLWYARLQLSQKPTDPPNELQVGQLDQPAAETTLRLRLHHERKLGWQWQYRARVEGVTSALRQSPQSAAPLRQQGGWLAYGEAVYSPEESRLQLTGRLGWFATDGASTRIYTYERTPPSRYSVPGFTGRGLRTYYLARYAPTSHLDIWFSLGMTLYADRGSIGTGNDKLNGSAKTDVLLQLRYSLDSITRAN